MSFTGKIKEELTRIKYPSACCRMACLSAFLRTSGSVFTRGGEVGFSFFTESKATAEYFASVMDGTFSLKGRARANGSSGREKYSYEYLSAGTADILKELGILVITSAGISLSVDIDRYLVESECCKRAYMAGAFLGGGSCTIPSEDVAKNTGYHLEVVFSYYETAHAFAEILAEFDILAKLIERKNNFVVYIKNNDELQEFLSLIGAEESLAVLSETVVEKDYNNNVNRKINCDLGNISKQVAAAARQIEAINAISSSIGLDSLRPELKRLCLLRLNDDCMTFEELAEAEGVTKSCINHRMRKILRIASEIKN
ncbi:MAG: DNA-binding protein WhiA [Clostridia bacterium]|nr:DNA-binding protein WhiA [Clostridia bacterium]